MHFRLSPHSVKRLLHGIFILVSVFALNASVLAQSNRDSRSKGDRKDDRGSRNSVNPDDIRSRMLNALRDQFEVTDDEEWALISERIAKVSELRRSLMGGGGLGGGGLGDPRGGGRGSTTNNPEIEALRATLKNKGTDADLTARLTRLREVRKENEAKLLKAQEELRAVLSVRQEALAVMFGLLT